MFVPKLTIITATLNSERTLDKCLKSVGNQTAISDIEHIIIDGLSIDNTMDIVLKYPHISQYISSQDRGIYHAFNKGLELASADLIYFLNSDDELISSETVEKVLNTIRSNDMFLCGTIVTVDELTGSHILSFKHNEPNFKPKHQAFFARKRLFNEIGPFNECFSIAADGYFMHRAINEFKGIFIDDVICKYSSGGMSSTDANLHKLTKEYEVIEKLLNVNLSRKNIEQINIDLKKKNTALKRIISVISCQSFDSSSFQDKTVAIFGYGELSIAVRQLFKLKGIKVSYFIATKLPTEPTIDGLTLLDLKQSFKKNINVVINCIEGSHALEIDELIIHYLPSADVISWKDL